MLKSYRYDDINNIAPATFPLPYPKLSPGNPYLRSAKIDMIEQSCYQYFIARMIFLLYILYIWLNTCENLKIKGHKNHIFKFYNLQ